MERVKGDGGALYVVVALAPLACILAYGQALSGPLFFDDVPNLLANELVQIKGGAFDEWRVAALSSNAGLFYRPLAMLSFALNHAVSGEFTAISLKATNLAIHLVIGALIYCFTLALLRSPAVRGLAPGAGQWRPVAALAAALWLLHPMHVSTVLYAVQRMAQMSTMFTLAGLLLYTRYRLRWAETGADPGEVIAAGLWLILLCLFASLSKENGALLPWLIAVIEVTLFQGIWRGQPHPGLRRLGWFALLLPVLAVLGIVIVSPEYLPGRFLGREFSLLERLLTQSRALWQYLDWLALPNILEMGFFHDDFVVSHGLWAPVTTALSLFAWALVLAAIVLWHKRYPLAAFAFLFYLVAHSMESSILPLELVFEHRNYLPSVGFAVLAAVGLFRLCAHLTSLRLNALVGALLLVFTVLLALRAHAWRDEMSLAHFNVVNHPQSARANFFYANALFRRFQQAESLGLDEDEKRALAVTARGHFQYMHTLNEREFAPLVMLYQLDTQYFPGLVQDNDWLGVIEELAQDRRLQSSDRTALDALARFSTTPAGALGRGRVAELLHDLVARYPWNTELLASQYRFLAAAGGADSRATLLTSLEYGAQLNSTSPEAAALLAQFHGADNLSATYEAIRQWLHRDVLRREIAVIREIFDN